MSTVMGTLAANSHMKMLSHVLMVLKGRVETLSDPGSDKSSRNSNGGPLRHVEAAISTLGVDNLPLDVNKGSILSSDEFSIQVVRVRCQRGTVFSEFPEMQLLLLKKLIWPCDSSGTS